MMPTRSTSQSMTSDLSDEELMHGVCQGIDQAFGTLYSRYFQPLYGYANKLLGNRETAADTVQEVFMTLLEKPERFDGARAFRPWIYTVTANRCRNLLRDGMNRKHSPLETAAEPQAQDHHGLDLPVLSRCLNGVFQSLSKKEKQIHRLRFQEGKSLREIAATLGLPEGSVKSGLYYLLRKYDIALKTLPYEKE